MGAFFIFWVTCVPVDFWRQRGRPHGPGSLPLLLSGLRTRLRHCTGCVFLGVHDSLSRREWRNFGCTGGIHRLVSRLAHSDARAPLYHMVHSADTRCGVHRAVVPHAILKRNRLSGIARASEYWGRGLVGPCRGIHTGRHSGPRDAWQKINSRLRLKSFISFAQVIAISMHKSSYYRNATSPFLDAEKLRPLSFGKV
jgi:hypothetical protein